MNPGSESEMMDWPGYHSDRDPGDSLLASERAPAENAPMTENNKD